MMIGILSDAHGNGPAFNQAIEFLRKHGVSRFIYLGDAVGYIPSIDVVAALRLLGSEVICVKGNHEVMLLNNSCDPEEEEVYRLKSVRNSLKVEDRDFIQSWPTHHMESINGRRILFVHGSPKNHTSGYVYPETDLSLFDESYNYVFMGHTHYPFIRQHGTACFINVGSCGMPRDDGRYGSVALFDTRTRSARILRFDITAESRQVLEQFPMVHPSVREVYGRRRPVVMGDIL